MKIKSLKIKLFKIRIRILNKVTTVKYNNIKIKIRELTAIIQKKIF